MRQDKRPRAGKTARILAFVITAGTLLPLSGCGVLPLAADLLAGRRPGLPVGPEESAGEVAWDPELQLRAVQADLVMAEGAAEPARTEEQAEPGQNGYAGRDLLADLPPGSAPWEALPGTPEALFGLLAAKGPGKPKPDRPVANPFIQGINLDREAKRLLGPEARAFSTSNHVDSWIARSGGATASIDAGQAVTEQFGKDWKAVKVGVGRYDWRALRWDGVRYYVIPIVTVAYDLYADTAGVRKALASYTSVIQEVQRFYRSRAGKAFRTLSPLVVKSSKSAAQWLDMSEDSEKNRGSNHWAMLFSAQADIKSLIPEGSALSTVASGSHRYSVAPYGGAVPKASSGAGAVWGAGYTAMQSTSIRCPGVKECQEAVYANGHELGHAVFDLGHACDSKNKQKGVNCNNSLMQVGRPPKAILLDEEIAKVKASAFAF